MFLAASAGDSPNYTLPTLLAAATLLGVIANIIYSILSRRGDRSYDREQRQLDRDSSLEAVRLTLADAATARQEERADAAKVRADEAETARNRRFEQRILETIPEFDQLDDKLTDAILHFQTSGDYADLGSQFPAMIKFVNAFNIYAETEQTEQATMHYSHMLFELWRLCRKHRDSIESDDGKDYIPGLSPFYSARAKVILSFRQQLGLRHVPPFKRDKSKSLFPEPSAEVADT